MDKKFRSQPSTARRTLIHVVVVESHHHALEHIHAALRKSRLLGKSWRMVHFDAHPDIACGDFPARACFQPLRECDSNRKVGVDGHDAIQKKNLYELLDSTTSGIAEWILPLVLAADLEKIYLIKPQCAKQFPRGTHIFSVGCHLEGDARTEIQSFLDLPDEARLKVDWRSPYYWEDNSVVPTSELLFRKKVELSVSEVADGIPMFHCPWILDICLDYFSCRNPFIDDLQRVDSTYTEDLIVLASRAHQAASASDDFHKQWHGFLKAMRRVFSTFEDELLLDEAVCSLEPFVGESALRENLKIHVFHNRRNAEMGEEALENLLLPHESVTIEQLDQRLKDTTNFVAGILKTNPLEPFLVTIARSTIDGFTPSGAVEKLQKGVMEAVHELLCGCSTNVTRAGPTKCRLKIVLDYGEWEGSTLFD